MNPHYDFLVAIETYRRKIDSEWIDQQRYCAANDKIRIELSKEYAQQIQARTLVDHDKGRSLIASSRAAALHIEARANDDVASACCAAIVLLMDDAMQRLRFALRPSSKPLDFSFGPSVGGSKFSLVTFATANSFRHADEWRRLKRSGAGYEFTKNSYAKTSIEILEAAFQSPIWIEGHVCRDVLQLIEASDPSTPLPDLLVAAMEAVADESSRSWSGSAWGVLKAREEIEAEIAYAEAGFEPLF